jgi:hypothetical protein
VKTYRKIATLFLIGIFLTATIGITTYKHICSSEGAFTSMLIPSNHECKDHKEEAKDCCNEKTSVAKDDCCKDEVKSYKVQSDYIYESQQDIHYTSILFLPIKWLFSIFGNFSTTEYSNKKVYSYLNDPPYLDGGLSYLQFLRVWRL